MYRVEVIARDEGDDSQAFGLKEVHSQHQALAREYLHRHIYHMRICMLYVALFAVNRIWANIFWSPRSAREPCTRWAHR